MRDEFKPVAWTGPTGLSIENILQIPDIARMPRDEGIRRSQTQVDAVGFDGLQSLDDLRNNWNRLLDVAGLTPEERREAVRLFVEKVEKVSGTEI